MIWFPINCWNISLSVYWYASWFGLMNVSFTVKPKRYRSCAFIKLFYDWFSIWDKICKRHCDEHQLMIYWIILAQMNYINFVFVFMSSYSFEWLESKCWYTKRKCVIWHVFYRTFLQSRSVCILHVLDIKVQFVVNLYSCLLMIKKQLRINSNLL